VLCLRLGFISSVVFAESLVVLPQYIELLDLRWEFDNLNLQTVPRYQWALFVLNVVLFAESELLVVHRILNRNVVQHWDSPYLMTPIICAIPIVFGGFLIRFLRVAINRGTMKNSDGFAVLSLVNFILLSCYLGIIEVSRILPIGGE
jgi:hypothetical protein